MSRTGRGFATSPRGKVRDLVPELTTLVGDLRVQGQYRGGHGAMDDFNSETDSDYTSYWRDWVSLQLDFHTDQIEAYGFRTAQFGRIAFRRPNTRILVL